MRCNACWRELEGRAVSMTCGHILCTDDATNILNNDAACPVCDEVLSKSLLKAVEINPSEEWMNMAMVGMFPHTSVYGKKIIVSPASPSTSTPVELEMQFKMNKIVAQCQQKCETMQKKFTDKLEQVNAAYQKMANWCQVMHQEFESLSQDKQELQKKFSEKSRQIRLLEEMFDQLRNEYETLKRPAIQPSTGFYSRPDGDLFTDHQANMMDNRESLKTGHVDDVWPTRSPNSGPFDIYGGSPLKNTVLPDGMGNTRGGGHPVFTDGTGTRTGNSKSTMRNLILSPIKRPRLSRGRPPLFTL